MGNSNGRTSDGNSSSSAHPGNPTSVVKIDTSEEPSAKQVILKSEDAAKRSSADDSTPGAATFEVVACKKDELKIGEMRHVSVPGQKQQILVGKGYDGEHFAITSACSHYNAFLKSGALGDGRIRCPWHGACFSTKTGDIEEYPCNDGVYVFKVKTHGEDILVSGDSKNVDEQRRVFPMSKYSQDPNEKTVIIIGGGPAALICAETLRKESFSGKIVVLAEESNLPYDRPKLSKILDVSIEKIQLRKEDFLKKYDIDFRRNAKVTSVDFENKFVSSVDDSAEGLRYDYLVIATGQRVRELSVDDTKVAWKNIHYLRTLEDANALCEAGKTKNVVILGSSFIGMECAAYFSDKAATVTVISRTRVPFQHSFGPDVGEAIKTELFDKKGVVFLPSIEKIVDYQGEESAAVLKSVRLSDGTTLDLDLLIVGIGSIPNTEFLRDTSLKRNPRTGALIVDEYMATNIADVYGAGDVTEFPLAFSWNVRTTIGHWNIAHSLGRTAALSIVGKKASILSVPYFWTTIFNKSIRFAGYGYNFDNTYIHGSLNGMKFVAYYLKGDMVVAAGSLMYDPVVSRYAELVSKGAVITLEIIKDDPELTKTAERIFSVAA